MQGIGIRLAGVSSVTLKGRILGRINHNAMRMFVYVSVTLWPRNDTAIFVASKVAATIWKVTEKHKQKHALHCG